MGLDIYASIIVGEKIISASRIIKSTKYNTDTGKPFEVSNVEHFWVYENDKTEVNMEHRDLDVYFSYRELNDEGLSGIYGMQIALSPSNRKSNPAVEFELDKASLEIQKYFVLTNRKAKIFAHSHISY